MMKFPADSGEIIAIRADQKMARQCYADSLKTTRESDAAKNAKGEKAEMISSVSSVSSVSSISMFELDLGTDMYDSKAEPTESLEKFQLGVQAQLCTKVGSQLDPTLKEQICTVLLKNAYLFAWKTSDMPGIDPNFLCHKLSICPEVRPVAQRKRKLSEERQKTIEKETTKLIKANFIRKVKYTTWLANVVMVKKG